MSTFANTASPVHGYEAIHPRSGPQPVVELDLSADAGIREIWRSNLPGPEGKFIASRFNFE